MDWSTNIGEHAGALPGRMPFGSFSPRREASKWCDLRAPSLPASRLVDFASYFCQRSEEILVVGEQTIFTLKAGPIERMQAAPG